MTAAQLLAACDAALAARRPWRRRTPVLVLTAPTVFGLVGHAVPDGYGYTWAQVTAIRDTILAAARADLDGRGA